MFHGTGPVKSIKDEKAIIILLNEIYAKLEFDYFHIAVMVLLPADVVKTFDIIF